MSPRRMIEAENIDKERPVEFMEFVLAVGYDEFEYEALWDRQKAILKQRFVEAMPSAAAVQREIAKPREEAKSPVEPEKVHAAFRFDSPVFIEARDAGEPGKPDNKGPREFIVQAYNGGKLSVANYDLPVVMDLDGMIFAKSIIANMHHDKSKLIGHITDKDIADGALTMEGKVSVPGPDADKFLQAHDNGFPWQASIEAMPSKLYEVPDGKSVTVNGQTLDGPMYVAAKSKLYGVAFLPRGADEETSVSVAATALAG